MRVKSIRIENWKSFDDSGEVQLGSVNVLVGRNNSGKSAFVRAVQQMQAGSESPTSDIRIGHIETRISIALQSDHFYQDGLRYFGKELNFVGNDIVSLGISMARHAKSGNVIQSRSLPTFDKETFTPPMIPSVEPNNFIYTYFSKRKVAIFDQQVDEMRTLSVAPDLRNLASKVLRLASPTYPGHEEYTRLCHDVLGFQVTTYASDQGQKAGVSVGRYDHIPLEAMGEGVASQLGLIVDLCMADGNLYLIEEPENDVHPEGLKTLLKVIIEKAKEGNQFIITTHSNVVVKNLGADSRLFNVSLDFTPGEVPTSTIRQVENTPEARIGILRQLGYELYDSDLNDGWLFLEESSAQVIIRNYLIPWFVPRLSRIQTISAGGVGKVEPAFEDFRRLFLFAHLEKQYQGRAWVAVDGDDAGHKVVTDLKKAYKTWPAQHFSTWSKPDFELYYPGKFSERVTEILRLPHDKKRQPKKVLLDEVKTWCDDNETEARNAFAESATEIIDYLKRIDVALFGEAT